LWLYPRVEGPPIHQDLQTLGVWSKIKLTLYLTGFNPDSLATKITFLNEQFSVFHSISETKQKEEGKIKA